MKTKPNLLKRSLATIIDYGFFYLVIFTYIAYFGEPNNAGGYSIEGIPALVVPIVWFAYFVVIEAVNGATIGHQLFNLSVKTLDNQAISLMHSLKRHLLDPVEILMFGIPALIAIKNSDNNQRIGDMWAKTVIIDLAD